MSTPRKTPSQPKGLTPEQAAVQHGELISEVRVLTREVGRLHNIFVRRTVLWWVLGIETVVVVLALVAVFILSAVNHSNTQHLVSRFQESCKVRNAQINGTRRYITDNQNIQADSQKVTAELLGQLHITITPQEAKSFASIQKRYTDALKRYQKSQPKSIPCKVNGG